MESRARKHRLREPVGVGDIFRNKKIKTEKREVMEVSGYQLPAGECRDSNQNFRYSYKIPSGA
jgi:hypothetical protein